MAEWVAEWVVAWEVGWVVAWVEQVVDSTDCFPFQFRLTRRGRN